MRQHSSRLFLTAGAFMVLSIIALWIATGDTYYVSIVGLGALCVAIFIAAVELQRLENVSVGQIPQEILWTLMNRDRRDIPRGAIHMILINDISKPEKVLFTSGQSHYHAKYAQCTVSLASATVIENQLAIPFLHHGARQTHMIHVPEGATNIIVGTNTPYVRWLVESTFGVPKAGAHEFFEWYMLWIF